MVPSGTTLTASERDLTPVGKPGRTHARKAGEDMAGSESDDVPTSGGPFLTVAEVAARIRVSKMTVYRLVHSGQLEAVRVGRSFRVPEDAVDEYIRRSFFQAG